MNIQYPFTLSFQRNLKKKWVRIRKGKSKIKSRVHKTLFRESSNSATSTTHDLKFIKVFTVFSKHEVDFRLFHLCSVPFSPTRSEAFTLYVVFPSEQLFNAKVCLLHELTVSYMANTNINANTAKVLVSYRYWRTHTHKHMYITLQSRILYLI